MVKTIYCSQMKIDYLVLVGLTGQFFFFLRFIVQWYQSEKKKKPVLPKSFWGFSIVGAIILLIYSIARKDFVFIISSILQLIIYFRNLILHQRQPNINLE